jgi:hypothetical protein
MNKVEVNYRKKVAKKMIFFRAVFGVIRARNRFMKRSSLE